jgi:hypothetical protein
MRKTILLSCLSLLFINFLIAQNSTLSGVVTDAANGEPLIGATVKVGKNGAFTDFDGIYKLEVKEGTYTVEISYVGYEPVNEEVTIKGDTQRDFEIGSTLILNEVVVVADIAIERETPVAFSNIPTIKLDEELAGQDLPMILNSTPGAYATQAGGGDGDARITIRGFDQRNISVMLDGIPVNDMENGWVYWSNWFGLDLVTQTMQVQRGLGASKLSVPSVGGTINILTKGIDSKKSIRFKQELGNNGYLRSTFGLNTGRLKGGWGLSAAASYKEGDGWVDGTFTKGYFYYLRVDKELGAHRLSFSAFGAPQEHGQRPFTTEIGQVDSDYARKLGITSEQIDALAIKDLGRRYNEHWGYLDGEVLNTRKNYYHKPQISLRHSWQGSERFYISNVAYISIGDGGGTAPEGAGIPRTEDQLLNLDKAVENNQPSVFNPEGRSNTILRSSINNHFWAGFLSTAKYEYTPELSLSFGVDGRYYQGDHYREVYNLLGGTGWGPNNLQEGDRFDYDYTGLVRWAGVFALAEYKQERWAAFANISAAYNSYAMEDHVKMQELDWVNIPGATIKLGATYKIDNANSIFFNTGYLSKAQRFTNVINTNRFGDKISVFNNYDNENTMAFELGYSFKSQTFSANINTYITNWQNKPLDQIPTVALDPSDPESERIALNVPGIDALHQGIELDFAYKPSKKITIEGLASIGDWKWNSSSTASIELPNQVSYSYEFDAKGVHVGDAAQLQLGGLVRYEPIRGLYFKLNGTWFGKNYADFQPEDLQGVNGGRESWQLPDYFLTSAHAGYYFKVKGVGINVRANVLNLLDEVYVSDARNNDDFNSPAFNDYDAKSASVHFGQGRRWNMSLQLNF